MNDLAGFDWIATAAEADRDQLIALRRAIHAEPELGLDCPLTRDKIEPIPCPNCLRYQEDMCHEMRKNRHGWMNTITSPRSGLRTSGGRSGPSRMRTGSSG